jgi:hypothetical protein
MKEKDQPIKPPVPTPREREREKKERNTMERKKMIYLADATSPIHFC